VSKRDCVFLVADTNMETVFKAFLTDPAFPDRLECAAFGFNPAQDLLKAAGRADPGVYAQAHEYLRSYSVTHRYAVVVLDAEWSGSPGAEQIREKIQGDLCRSGWAEGQTETIVIEPELESWIWVESPQVGRALGWKDATGLREWLEAEGWWPAGADKPTRPKEAVEAVLEKTGKSRSSARYGKIVREASIKHCNDPAFRELKTVLQRWFPKG